MRHDAVLADADRAVPGALPPGQERGSVLYIGREPQALGLAAHRGIQLYDTDMGGTALAILEQQRIDLIVCDLREAALEGLAFLESLCRGWPGITRLALGPAGDAALVIAALNGGGISRYLPDIYSRAEVAASVCEALKASSSRAPDISANGQLRTLETMRQSSQFLNDIVDNLPTAVQIKSVQNGCRVVMWNKAAEHLYGVPRTAAIGRNVQELWPEELAPRMHASDCEVVAKGGVLEYPNTPAHNPKRGTIPTHVRKVLLHDAAGNPAHILVIADDITARLAAEAAMLEAQARFQHALDAAQDGIWEYNLRTGSVFMSERLQRMLHFTPADLPRGPDTTSHLVHPEDLQAYRDTYKGLLKRGEILRWEGRFRQPDGGYRWFRVRGIATLDADGRAILVSGTTSDIDDARRAEDELRRHRDDLAGLVEQRTAGLMKAMQAAECANQAKSEFLANMSHELRTPMHAIISFANFGIDKFEKVDRSRLKGYFEHIHTSAGRLLGLLNNLLDLSKLEAGKMEIHARQVSVAELLRDAALESEALAEQHKLRLQIECDGIRLGAGADAPAAQAGRLAANWDGPRMLQVLRNLLSNAIKFSPADSVIKMSARPQAGPAGAPDAALSGIEIRVSDQGMGIPPDELELVFDKFAQSSKTKTGAGGTGLGLAICREIVAAHGGRIHAEANPAPCTGVTFVVRLPLNAAAPAPSSDAPH